MKKTVIINIGTSILHITEDAYEVLTKYMHEIKIHFAKNIDDFEIVKDIEYRIAEMLNESLAQKEAQLIEMPEVESVMARMGNVKDFELGEEEEAPADMNYNTSIRKELFRDEDRRIIGGVCAGLSHYLRIPSIWIRIAFVLLSFGFAFGVLIYLVLWMAVPRAKTRAEKMRMRGESQDLQAFQKSFEEELGLLRSKMQQAGTEFRPVLERSESILERAASSVVRMFKWVFRVIGKIFGFLVLLFGSLLVISLIMSLAALLGFWDADIYNFFPFNVVNPEFRIPLIFSAFVLLFIPIVGLLLFAFRTLFNLQPLNNRIALAMLFVWLVALFVGGMYSAKLASEFKEQASLEQTISIKSKPSYTLTLNNEADLRAIDSAQYNLDEGSFQNRKVVYRWYSVPNNMQRNVRLHIKNSDAQPAYVLQNFEAQGRTFKEALYHAKQIDYKFIQDENHLKFNYWAYLMPGQLFRDQTVRISLNVPVGTKLKIHDDLFNFMYINYNCPEDAYREGSFTFWEMTQEGLKCVEDKKNN